MASQTILWTTLPNGIKNGKLQLSLHVSPQLKGSGKLLLKDFPDFSGSAGNWPEKIKQFLYAVDFGGTIVTADKIKRVSPDPSVEIWTALFKESVTVKSYQDDSALADAPIVTYDQSNLSKLILQIYGDVATGSPDKLVSTKSLIEKYSSANINEPAPKLKAEESKQVITQKNLLRKTELQQKLSTQKLKPELRKTIDLDINFLIGGSAYGLKKEAETTLNALVNQLNMTKSFKVNAPNLTTDFLRFKLASRPYKLKKPVLPEPVDFHESISLLGDYPRLERLLGLVVDLEIDMKDVPATATFIRAVPSLPDTVEFKTPTKFFCPKTLIEGLPQNFRGKSKPGSKLKDGLLDVSNKDEFDIVQIDVEGGVMKFMNLIKNAEEQAGGIPADEPPLLADTGAISGLMLGERRIYYVANLNEANEDTGLPTLRTAGMSLIQRDAGAKLVDDLKMNADWTASLAAYESISPGKLQPVYNPSIFQTAPAAFKKADDKTFYADDLVRGYAVDVWDSETKKWRTVCKRKGSYKLGSQFLDLDNGTLTTTQATHSDESCIEAALIGDPNNEEEKQHLIETLFRWEGWSLVAPRPGKSIDEANTPQTINTEKEAALGLNITVAPEPGTLPRLRFGRSYRFRLRALDIAGNSKKMEDLGDSDFSTASSTEFFQRYEPVLSPTLIFRNKQKPGESIEHCVIRSNYNQTTEKYKEDYELEEFLSERHFVAPKTSQIMSELHGKFDNMEASDAYKLIVSRDADFPKPPSVNGQLGSNPVIMDELISLPYLPDPLVQGAMLAFYDRFDKAVGQPVKIDFYPSGKSWPDPVSFRLKVIEGTDAPNWNESSRILTAYVAKAEYLKVRYSSVINETQLDIFGVWNWIKNRNPGNIGDLRKLALSGKHWMLSPSREIILLHAVQQPLKEPVIDKIVPSKTVGSTFALLSGSLLSDAKSTTKLDMLAEWTEQIDDPDSGQEPKTTTGKAHVFDFLLEDSALNDKYLFGNQNREPQQPGGYIPTDLINLGQIKVDKAVYIDKADVDKLIVTDIKPTSSTIYPKANPAIQPENQSGKQFKIQGLHQVKTFGLTQADDQRHEFGDTKYRKVRYKVSANTRFREYFLDFKNEDEFPPDFPLVRDSAIKEVKVLSSARPAAPKPLYILPTFSWEKKTDGKNIISRRYGNGLRVYLDRPWYSSGDEELLGVILKPLTSSSGSIAAMFSSILTNMKLVPYITQWGLDPLWASSGKIKPVPTLSAFTSAARVQAGVYLDELENMPVNVAGHTVAYDPEKKLWFSDIVINAGESYFPFVRLALARYQPNSLQDCFISRVIMTDFIQLVPDRTATVSRESNNKIKVQVSGIYAMNELGVIGRVNRNPAEAQKSRKFIARIEQRVGGIQNPSYISVSETVLEGAAEMIPAEIQDAKMVWAKELTLSDPSAWGKKTYRVVVEEYELFKEGGERLVYADAIEI